MDEARRNYEISLIGVELAQSRVEEQELRSQLGLGVAPARDDIAGLDLEGSLSDVSRRAVRRAEKAKILQVLNAVGFDRAQAAEHLDISGKTLLHKLREYGLEGALSASDGTT